VSVKERGIGIVGGRCSYGGPPGQAGVCVRTNIPVRRVRVDGAARRTIYFKARAAYDRM